ncbi:protein wech-like [Magallana gigas]|uniref:protein wech-like n=1 Tax=Magallana gigas TaxID=29159 RepID=UPI003340CA8E
MDPRSVIQDVCRCDLCETAIVQSYCDFCHVNLCKLCIGEHISDDYDKHKIVPFKNRRSTLIYPKCEIHPQKTCKFQCKDCNNIVVCSSCAISKKHKGHDFVDVREVYKTKKEIIKRDTKELENHISTTYNETALDLENQLANLDEGYDKLTTAMSKQGELWHSEIETVIIEMKTEINEIKAKHRKILQKHLDEIKQIQSLMEQSLLALKEIANSNEVNPTIRYSSKIRNFSKLPPKIMVKMPTFIPKQIDCDQLFGLFGQIIPLSTATEEYALSLKPPNTSFRELLDKPELVTTIQTEYSIPRSVTCLNEDRVWTSGWNDKINCFSIKGSLLRKVNTESGEMPNDIAVDSNGHIIYLDWQTRTVNKVKNGEIKVLITLRGWTPVNLCVISTSDLLVSMYSNDKSQSKVVHYSGYTEKQSFQFDDECKPLYSANAKIKYITENRNHDICLADWGANAVVVVNQDGKLRWRYTGYSSVTKVQPFRPYGITTDSESRILTTDCDNCCIHILDQNGQFLRYIDTFDLDGPWGVCVDNNDNLFVCESRESNVKKIKYLK